MARTAILAGFFGSIAVLPGHSIAAGQPEHRGLTASQIGRFIDDLRDDNVRFNAMEAMSVLGSVGPAAWPALEAALDSDDWQQRQLAAHLLRRLRPGLATDRMLAVTMEGLADDRLPFGRWEGQWGGDPQGGDPGDRPAWMPMVSNASGGIRWLMRHARDGEAKAEAALIRGLHSRDYQTRFLCAAALGYEGRTAHTTEIVRVLGPHLRDNRVRGDAVLACQALLGLGKPAVGPLRGLLVGADAQQTRLIRLLTRFIEHPPATAVELRAAAGLWRTGDPLNYLFVFDRAGVRQAVRYPFASVPRGLAGWARDAG